MRNRCRPMSNSHIAPQSWCSLNYFLRYRIYDQLWCPIFTRKVTRLCYWKGLPYTLSFLWIPFIHMPYIHPFICNCAWYIRTYITIPSHQLLEGFIKPKSTSGKEHVKFNIVYRNLSVLHSYEDLFYPVEAPSGQSLLDLRLWFTQSTQDCFYL